LVLTSSFPSSPDDETCGYIRDFARRLGSEFGVTVLAPPDAEAGAWPTDTFTLVRSWSLVPRMLDPFQGGVDLNSLSERSKERGVPLRMLNLLAGCGNLCCASIANLALLVSLACFFLRAFWLALRADAICSHWMVPSGLVGALLSRLLGKPHVAVEHSGALHLLARIRGGRRIARFIVASSDRVVTVSSHLKRKLVDLCPESKGKVAIIPMGINVAADNELAGQSRITGQRLDIPSRRRMVLFLGRLTEIKGLDVLLRAIRGLRDLQLIVAGGGEHREKHETLARRLGVNTTFIGPVGAGERRELFAGCDAVIIPSRVLANGRTEGMPVVCLEAMAAGIVVIASKVGGLREIIANGANGLLFDVDDHLMLRDRLMLALGDGKLRERISENARQTAAAYDWSRIGPQFSEIIRIMIIEKGVFATKTQRREATQS
jgi:glycosyltransferase involved in cell wall biosynthesis